METKNKIFAAVAVLLVVLVALFSYVKVSNANEAAEAAAMNASKAQEQLNATNSKLDALSSKVEATETQLADTKKELTTKQAEIEKLKTEAAKPVVVTPPVAASVNGETIDNIFVGDGINFVVDDQDVDQLLDTTIDFNDESYEVHEEFAAVPGKLLLASSQSGDEDFADKPYVTMDRGGLVYSYVFDETVKVSEITNDEPLKMRFLGQSVEIVSLSSSKAVLRSGTEVFIKTGEKKTVAGKEITLDVAGTNSNVYVCVAGECKILKPFKSERVGGLDVRVEEVLSSDEGNGAATLVVGTDTVYEQKNADGWYGNDEFKFEIVLTNSNTELKELRIVYDEARNKLDKEFKPLGLGEELCFPNNYVCVKFDELKNNEYVDVEVTFDDLDVRLANDTDVALNCAVVTTSADDSVVINNDETDEFYVCTDTKAYYEDVDGDWHGVALSQVSVENDETKLSLSWNGGHLKFTDPAGNFIVLQTDLANQKLGTTEDESEDSELQFNSLTLGTSDEDVLTTYGTILRSPDSNGDNDEVVFSIPSDELEGQLLVYSK